ncbi:TetR/AcrR family transcriptional regulator [Marinilactibacillus sp. XAAS-LB27]|uniref:TetR/AcrR family transcriptional regulator n=1 Tax=Marinilactibacillus sp. XAAS-LB27 TaxID=3114538 RepID=UPI002E1912B1|nr:TetR/AcrR family transcriptional regulator [Marinilactibacillus sp. XAAS-LB27]
MKADEIKQSALAQFVVKGFEATTLDDIVKEIGIKKQSVYSHFKTKEDIFLQVMQDATDKEVSFLKNFFIEFQEESAKDMLNKLLMKYRDRYLKQENLELKFVLRMAFMPPFHLRDTVMNQFHLYNRELEEILMLIFEKDEEIKVTPKEGVMSFSNLLDGILVELIYSGSSIEKLDEKLSISWEVYWKGITN